ncbi:polyprenyl synthetase family protein [Nocardia brasiliensis]|nr:polyprenyl synthetase family protein [Nocardia brasiliensis]
MTADPDAATAIDLARVRVMVDRTLDKFLTDKATIAERQHLPPEMIGALHAFVGSGAKRLRPQLCVLGWLAAAGDPDLPLSVVRCAAAIELCHTAILIHDDIIDHSDTRRGRPTVHRALEQRRPAHSNSAEFGVHAAILLGDLAMVWADELLHHAQLTGTQAETVLPLFDSMRTSVNYGQYLDLLTTNCAEANLQRALEIIEHKTTSYTFEGPLRIGAALAGAPPTVHAALVAYARPLGIAIQLQNDLLDTYGSQDQTIRPSLSDLREGKCTALLAIALTRATPDQRARLQQIVGKPTMDDTDATECKEILDQVSRNEVDEMVRTRWNQAKKALHYSPFPLHVIQTLAHVAEIVALGTINNADTAVRYTTSPQA